MTAVEFDNKLISLKENLMGFAYRLTSNRDDAKDLLQDTFAKAILYRDKFIDNTKLKSLAFTIMKNIFINNYRKAVRANMIFKYTKDHYLNYCESKFENPDKLLSAKEINININKLNNKLKEPFLMYIQGFKYQEIADRLNIKLGTVKSMIFRARKILIESLKGYN